MLAKVAPDGATYPDAGDITAATPAIASTSAAVCAGQPVTVQFTGADFKPTHSTITQPHPARIASVNVHGHTRIELTQPADTTFAEGELVMVHAWPTTMKSQDIATAVAVSTTAVETSAPFGAINRKVWIRRP